jgi:TolA-binding protein
MRRIWLFIFVLQTVLIACQATGDKDTIAGLRHVQIEIKEEKIEGGIEKAMASYQRFLEETPGSAKAPEAMRRLADLKIEKEYGSLPGGSESSELANKMVPPVRQHAVSAEGGSLSGGPSSLAAAPSPIYDESEEEFENRATRREPAAGASASAEASTRNADDLDRASTREALALYKKLLNDYPLYERNDQVLYQMSRAYEELGRIQEAMEVMDRIVRKFPRSRYIDEVQFRRAEYFFTHKRYLDAEEAYASIVDNGVGSFYYELALYKLGWTCYKQEIYEDALDRFIALLDHKVSMGYDFEQTKDEQERKRTQDTFRVISLSFSNLGGAASVVEYFARHGKRSYEDSVYSNLGEYYFDKRRYADASASYNAFVSRNPFHKSAPNFHMRVIEIHAAGGFPSLVLDAKKSFATTYGLKAEYWKYFDPAARPDILGHLKTNLMDLAGHYHASYQKPKKPEDKPAHFKEALHWYREFLDSFPAETESPNVNYLLADLLLENSSFGEAAVEFEKTAYGYPLHEKSSKASYAAVYAYREHLNVVAEEKKDTVKLEVIRSSLKFADTFPKHKKAAIVLGAAADDLYAMKEFEQALAAASKLTDAFPDAEIEVVRAAWLVVGHSSYELLHYSEAEAAYLEVLNLLPENDESRGGLVDNLAASIYKQAEQAKDAKDYRLAADHFLRVAHVAPTSKIRPNAEYDGAAALIELKDWEAATTVLKGFRESFPGHPLQPDVTKKMAYVYRESERLSLAANEFERIERESKDDEVRREALLIAAELYAKEGGQLRALEVYRRYVGYFWEPVEVNLELRDKIAEILKAQNDRKAYLNELRQIVAIDDAAGTARTSRTRYLAAKSALVLAESTFDEFTEIKLVQPFEPNLLEKRNLMKTAVQKFNRLMDYELGEFTAAATFYLAEIYADFSQALMTSERPKGLSAMELEQYELAIEEQAYPFEEKAITVHESNLELISRGVYNEWIERSLQKLAVFVPARYAKPEEASTIIGSLETYIFEVEGPATPAAAVSEVENESADPGAAEELGPAAESETKEPAPVEEAESAEAGRSSPRSGDTPVPMEAAVQGEKLDGEEVVQ